MIKTISRMAVIFLVICTLFTGCAGDRYMDSEGSSKSSDDSENTGGTQAVQSGDTTENIIIASEDIVTLTAEDIRKKESESGKQAAVSIDIVCELYNEVQSRSKIRGTFIAIKNLGVSRVYLIMCSPSYPLMAGGGIAAVKSGVTASNIEKSLDNLGEDPNKIYIEICHELGLEAIAIIKPYEGGGGATVPEEQNVDAITSSYASSVTLDTVGGERIWFDSFISEHPEMRVKRKSGTQENVHENIRRIELLYYSGASLPDMDILNTDSANAPLLWVSRDNGSYTLCENIGYTYDIVSSYPIRDPNGVLLMTKDCIRLTVTVDDDFDYPYVAVTLGEENYLMKNSYWSRPYSMCRLYGKSGEISSTLGYYVRKPGSAKTGSEYVWGTETTPASPTALLGVTLGDGNIPVGVYPSTTASTGAENFWKYGFEYEYVYTSAVQNGFRSPIIALAVGKNEYVQGLLCEGYEEVRDYWISQVKSALDYGADGIDIRYDGHSAMVSDYYYYGYNAPIAEKYMQKYGVSLASEPVNSTVARRIMEIRGEFFMMFLEQASALVHENGGIFLSHFFATGYDGYNDTDYVPDSSANCFAQWKMPKIIIADYGRLIDICDEIVYKDYFTQYFSESDQKCGEALTEYAKARGKKIWVHCYVQQASQLNEHY
ncbi:MAG: hypothetical protein ACI3XQ_09040, partial [Eubacteriales bacterium]